MEIVLKNISYKYKNRKLLEKINLRINDNKITGIIGDNKTILSELIDTVTLPSAGQVIIDNQVVSKENLKRFRREVCLIKQNWHQQFFTDSIKEEMIFLVNRIDYKTEFLSKKMKQSLEIVGLSEDYLNKSISKLSTGEKKLVQVAISLLYNPNIIIFDEPFVELDYDNQRKLIKLIKDLKNKYKKTIIITSNNANLLYELTDELVVLKRGRVIRCEETVKIYQDVDFLINNELDIPNLVKFTYLAKRKNVKLSYHRDIRDLIKDVYKHV